MKNSEFVSIVVNALKLHHKDSHISKRFILWTGQTAAKTLMNQKLGDRSLFKNESLFRTIRCFPLKKESNTVCLGEVIPNCNSLMKSKEKLNGLIYGRYGNSIISVTTVDGKEFLETRFNKYISNMKRPYAKYLENKSFYYELDGYLYLPNSEVEAVDVTYIPFDESEIANQSDCEDCDSCKSIWDYEFICPDNLIKSVQQATLQEVASIFPQVSPDENPNMDENIRTESIQ